MIEPTAQWQVKRGFIALAICVLCAEGVFAGADRPCMSAFDPSILLQQMILFNLFLVPEILGCIAGIVAFVIAAIPIAMKPVWLVSASIVLAALAAVHGVAPTPAWSAQSAIIEALMAGAVAGLSVRVVPKALRFWLPLGALVALALGAMVFAFGHYGQNNCWP